MDILQAMEARHSVRQYSARVGKGQALQAEIAACNQEGGLRIQLLTEEAEAFGSPVAHGETEKRLQSLCPNTVDWRPGKVLPSAASKEELLSWVDSLSL